MTSQSGKQTSAIHILLNISRSKGYQTMKFGLLIGYNMRNIFLEKSYTKCGGEAIPRPFSKNQNWAFLWINSLKFYTVVFTAWRVESYRNILKIRCRSLAFTWFEAFLKNKEWSGTSFSNSFSAFFWRKMFLFCYILLTDQILSGRLYFIRYWAICVL